MTVVGLAGVHHQRQAGFARRLDVGAEHLRLHVARAEVVVEVEAASRRCRRPFIRSAVRPECPSAVRSGFSLASCGWVPTVHQMSGMRLGERRRSPRSSTGGRRWSTIRPTPAARARAMTASRSSSNWGACRFTWLSISMRGSERFAVRRACGEEGVGAVEVDRLGLGRRRRRGGPTGSAQRSTASRLARSTAGRARPRPGVRTGARNAPAPSAPRKLSASLHQRRGRRTTALDQLARQAGRAPAPASRPAARPGPARPWPCARARRSLRWRDPSAARRNASTASSRPGLEAEPAAAGADGGQQPARRMRDQEQHAAFGRLLQSLQQGVGGVGIHVVGRIDDRDPVGRARRRLGEELRQGARLVDRDELA